MTREQLIELGYKLVNCEGTEQELDEMYELFSKNVPILGVVTNYAEMGK